MSPRLARVNAVLATGWTRLGAQWLPFADAASDALPLSRLLRLALFQVSVGMATALLVGTLNRVMIVELGVHAWLVALMVSLPLVFAPLRALIGYRSDTHRSALGWRRVPYIWFGTLAQFGGFAIMPFALLVLTGEGQGPAWVGQIGAAIAFLMVGAGMHTTQTAGLALATDLAPVASRPRVVALMYVMLLAGLVLSGFAFALLLADFSATRLVQVVQGVALLTMVLNMVALWKQEPRDPVRARPDPASVPFTQAWQAFAARPGARRFLVAVALGTAAFSMQDIVLEPYGAEVLGLSVSATSLLTALAALGAMAAFALAARLLSRGFDPFRLAGIGVLVGIVAFSCIVLSAPFGMPMLFRTGTVLVGFGGGLFAVATLTSAMALERREFAGLALGAWGAVQATAAGAAIAAGGALRDAVAALGATGVLGETFTGPAAAYAVVYHVEIGLLFATLVAIGPLVRRAGFGATSSQFKFGLAQLPG